MIVNLIKSQQMFHLTLPSKIKGQYWITDTDKNGNGRQLISIEAVQEKWILKSNKKVSILDAENKVISKKSLKPRDLLYLHITETEEQVILFTESVDASRQVFKKYVMRTEDTLTIGRAKHNNLCYENDFVSGEHARLSYDGEIWIIHDMESSNGTYVNNYKVDSQRLNPGDVIYIMGLRLILGHNFFSINNPDGLLKINSNNLIEYSAQPIIETEEVFELPAKEYFFRAPKFHREIETTEVKIDAPPQVEKPDTVPMALMMGPSITMGLTSLTTGLLSVNNVLSNGGAITQALPTVMMSVSMLLGTILWPVITKKYEKKEKVKNEQKRQEKYMAYLDQLRDEIRRIGKTQSDILNENLIPPEACIHIIEELKSTLWERIFGQKDYLRLRLGIGTLPMNIDVKCPEKHFTMDNDNLQDAMLALGYEPKELNNVPISVSLLETNVIGLYGAYEATDNMLKLLLLQLVSLHSYDELKLMLITDKEHIKNWEFIRSIPHFWDDEKTFRFLATNEAEAKELSAYIEKKILVRKDEIKEDYAKEQPYYVIISLSKKISEKCEALHQLLKYKNNTGFSIIFEEKKFYELPKETKLVIDLTENNSRMFHREDITGKGIPFVPDKMDTSILTLLAQNLANIELDLASQKYNLPSMLTFLEMFHVSKIEHLNSLTRWKENNPIKTLQTPVGVDTYGDTFYLDLHQNFHGPHGLVAGMTGSGKSEFIITYILSMAVNYHPDEVAFILIDYKGGGLTGAFEDTERGIKLPHLAGTITNLDGAAVKRSLISIQSELKRRQAIFNEAKKIANEGTMDIYTYQRLYRDKIVSEPVPHLFIISDEFAELKSQQPEFMEQLISTARIGRSLGVHLILATQKPSGVVDDEIWSNSKFRVCLKVQEAADSQEMIKRPDAAELSQTGRFYLQVGFNELFALGQSAWCGAEYIPTETVEKSVDSSIQIVDNLGHVITNVKPEKKKNTTVSLGKQIVTIVKYLSDLADEEHIAVRPLWLPPISEYIYLEELEKKYTVTSNGILLNPIVGEYDDPFNQAQNVLTLPLSTEGNALVYGATGNGKTTFLTTLCYSLLKNHTAEELHLYIMDFGSETLKVFEQAPQVGDVITMEQEEKVLNFIRMLYSEIEYRKKLFSEYGGEYRTYCQNSGKILPNIVVLLNNYSGFAEQYENYIEDFTLLTRDGIKYGIYFVVTASSTNAVRYKTQQNFKLMLTMQLNDVLDYSTIVGRTEGLFPAKYKGRGLIAMDKVYEFQTAYCKNTPDILEYLRTFSAKLCKESKAFAKAVPVLPDVVTAQYVMSSLNGLKAVPIGIAKKSLDIMAIDISSKVVYPVVAQEIYDMLLFAEELVKLVSNVAQTTIIDCEGLLTTDMEDYGRFIIKGYETVVQQIFAEMVERNNVYKDSNLDMTSLDVYEEKVFVILGMKRLFDQLSLDGRDKLDILLQKAESFYKMHFIIIESQAQFNILRSSVWYKQQVTDGDGIWIGNGIADQYILKISKLTNDLYQDIELDYGYLLNKNRPILVKLLSSKRKEDYQYE